MKILVVGGGGREYALAQKISESTWVEEVYVAPGNDGMRSFATVVPNLEASDIRGLRDFAKEKRIDLVVPGPELPLVSGIVDDFSIVRIPVLGPGKEAARLEGSKIFACTFMDKWGIPFPHSDYYYNKESAILGLTSRTYPLVIKADGLASGRGVITCKKKAEAIDGISSLFELEAGKTGILIQDFAEGEEATITVMLDGRGGYEFLASSQDHKAAEDGDKGPNTGGMGAYSPAPVVTSEVLKIVEDIVRLVIRGTRREGYPYRGFLYIGIMVSFINGKPAVKVLEFNVRLGDPEAQAILARLEGNIVPWLLDCVNGTLKPYLSMAWDPRPAICLVLASHGYPGNYDQQLGMPIYGLKKVSRMEDVQLIHAGTKIMKNSTVINGGRVLNIVGKAPKLEEAINKVYKASGLIRCDGLRCRTDIGQKALKWLR